MNRDPPPTSLSRVPARIQIPRGAGGEAEPDRASVASRGSYRAPDVTGAGSPTEGAGLQGAGPGGEVSLGKVPRGGAV